MSLRSRSCRALLLLASLSTGCNVFDARLYQQTDMALPLCGRATPPTLCPGDFLFCDGFESESGLNFQLWSGSVVNNPTGTAPNADAVLEIANSPVCLGMHALHARAVAGQQQAFVYHALGNRPNPMHVRLYFYIKQYSLPFQLLGFHAPNGEYSTLYVDPSASALSYSTNFSSAMAVGSATLPPNRWLCMQLAVRFDPADGEVQLAIDGAPLADVNHVATDPMGAMQDSMNIGIVSTNNADNGVNDISVDEVAVSSQPIGC